MTENLDALAELVAREWSSRSAAERSAFLDRLPGGTPAPAPPPADAVRLLRQRAALSGAVAPRDLLRGVAEADRDRLLDLLAPQFDRASLSEGWRWTLRSGPRQEVLARLAADGTVRDAADDVADVPTDAAGDLLRDLARRDRTERGAALAGAAPGTAVQALAWALPLGGLSGHLAEARRQARLRAIANGYQVLVQHGVFGRDADLARLRAFADAPAEDRDPLPLLSIVGVGGSGKSTLLASFIAPYLDRMARGDETGPAVVVIDFDRVLFRADAELELSYEVTRQLGAAAPVASADFSALRFQHRVARREAGFDRYRGSAHLFAESMSHSVSTFEYDASEIIGLHRLDQRPVLLVLDTFEEWQREHRYTSRWSDAEFRILDWVHQLRSGMGLAGLRVVVSGRAELSTVRNVVQSVVPLGDLDRSDAAAVLHAQRIDQPAACALADIVGGNPLTLRVAARFYKRLSVAARTDFLAGDDAVTGQLDARVRRAVLYDRFLNHIADPRVRQLAHPGLALRRVTPPLVRHVLAVACGLGPVDDDTARRLTKQLAGEVWLVKDTPDGLRHQPDVRRGMLRMMSADPKYGETVRRIHEAAVRWYRDGGEDEFGAGDWQPLPPEQARVEALYHALMLVPEDGSVDRLRRAEPAWDRLTLALGEAVGDLPAGVAAQVRALRGEDLSAADALTLPDGIWWEWVKHKGDDLVREEAPAEALDLLHAGWAAGRERREPPWLAQAYCDTLRWSEYRPTLEFRSSRYAMLDVLLAGGPPGLVEARFPGPAEVGELFLDLLLTVAIGEEPARWADRRRPQLQQFATEKPGDDLFPVDQLRRALILLAADEGRPIRIEPNPGAIFRPDFRWLEAITRLARSPRDLWPTQIEVDGTPRSDDVLETWASRFSRAAGRAITLDRDALRSEPALVEVLRGDNPELRPAVCNALGIVVEQTGMAVLGRVAEWVLPVPVADLHPDALAAADPSAVRRTIKSLVVYVDRSGVLMPFLDRILAELPDHPALLRIHATVRRWEQVHRRLLDALAEQVAVR
ncbi:ATP-binding protein [Dactylosporangium sp. NPDC049742]|uniref:ATP-binding protein n=1 Tax=Dactylosporangium sp. NPDC049742 TaxID=3154737 RepID=UPI0034400CBE